MVIDFFSRVGDKVEHLGGDLVQWLSVHGLNLIIILLAAWFIRRFGVQLFHNIFSHTIRRNAYGTKADREKRLKTLSSMSSAFVRAGVYVIAGFMIVGEVNPSYTTALFASAGLATVALGFGAQSLIRDIVSGIFLISENQYRIGDEVELKSTSWAAQVEGIVEDITLRTTILRDLDGDVHHIPNGTIGFATNKTLGFNRINEDIVVSLDTDIERLEHIVNHVGEELAAEPAFKNKILDPPHVERIVSIHDKGISVKILAKTAPADRRAVRSELYHRLLKAFQKNDISLT